MKWEVMLKLINYIDSQVVVRRIWDVSKILSRDLRGQNLSPYANNTWFAFFVFILSCVQWEFPEAI